MANIGFTDIAEGKIRARVGEFLGLQQRIQKLMLTLDPDIQQQASALYGEQKALETDLPKFTEATSDLTTFSNIFTSAAFSRRMESQIDNVNELEHKAKGLPVQESSSLFSTVGELPWVKILQGTAAIFTIYTLLKNRGKKVVA